MNDHRTDYASLSTEELEARFREAFFCPDRIDGAVFLELEDLRAALEEKRPTAEDYDPEAAWERFLEDNADELSELWGPVKENAPEPARPVSHGRKSGRLPALLRAGLIAAAVLVLLAGAVLAAGPQLWSWVRGWDAPPEAAAGSPIRSALEDLGITEPVCPSYLPDGFILTEAHISREPLLLYELYTRGDQFISISVTSVSAADKTLYPRGSKSTQEYEVGETAHYLFSNDGSITAVWYTESCFVSISGNITIRAMKRIIDSVYAG